MSVSNQDLLNKYLPLTTILPGEYAQVGNLVVGVASLTPAGAQAILDFHQPLRDDGSVNNRKLIAGNVEQIATGIARGDFPLTGEPLIFDDRLCAIDYQHRCHAVIRAGVTIPEILVVIGVSNKSFEYLDQGSKRGVGQILNLHGYKSGNDLAAAAVSLNLYLKTGVFESQREVGNREVKHPTKEDSPRSIIRSQFRSPSIVREFIEEHPSLSDCVSKIHSLRTAGHQLRSRGVCSALLYVLRQVNRELADAFFEAIDAPLAKVIDMERTLLPVCRLRDRLNGTHILTVQEIICLTIKAWNAVYQGRSVSVLRWNYNEPYPEVAGISYIKGVPQLP